MRVLGVVMPPVPLLGLSPVSDLPVGLCSTLVLSRHFLAFEETGLGHCEPPVTRFYQPSVHKRVPCVILKCGSAVTKDETRLRQETVAIGLLLPAQSLGGSCSTRVSLLQRTARVGPTSFHVQLHPGVHVRVRICMRAALRVQLQRTSFWVVSSAACFMTPHGTWHPSHSGVKDGVTICEQRAKLQLLAEDTAPAPPSRCAVSALGSGTTWQPVPHRAVQMNVC